VDNLIKSKNQEKRKEKKPQSLDHVMGERERQREGSNQALAIFAKKPTNPDQPWLS
jgi:hypothetical protein